MRKNFLREMKEVLGYTKYNWTHPLRQSVYAVTASGNHWAYETQRQMHIGYCKKMRRGK